MSVDYNCLLNKYKCQFEGIENLVFYYDVYPTSYKMDEMTPDLWNRYYFSQGLKYVCGDTKNSLKRKRFEKNEMKYLSVLSEFITYLSTDNKHNKIGVITIPSSDKKVINQATRITKKTISNLSFSNVIDLTNYFTRITTKEKAHETGHRNTETNIETLAFSDSLDLSVYNLILVIDDVITSGNSFLAVKQIIEGNDYKGQILNFAFSRSVNHMAIEYHDKDLTAVQQKKGKKISGIIFDFDQTLVNDEHRNEYFESNFNSIDEKNMSDLQNFLEKNSKVYSTYKGVEEFQRKKIPFSIVSNSYRKRLQILFQSESILKSVYPYTYDSMIMEPTSEQKVMNEKYLTSPGYRNYDGKLFRYSYSLAKNIFLAPSKRDGDYYINYQKPNPKGVKQAIEWLCKKFDLSADDRIIGIGNTLEDMIAYNEAGIESVLGLWGIPEELKEFARTNWYATFVFESFEQLNSWVDKTN